MQVNFSNEKPKNAAEDKRANELGEGIEEMVKRRETLEAFMVECLLFLQVQREVDAYEKGLK